VRRGLCGSALILVCSIACGQKGPPLPPLVLIPASPALTAERRGATIEVAFTVPSANADGSRPANISRIDIFAVSGAVSDMSDLELIKRGTRVASLPVKTPRNPNDTVEPGESTDVLEPPEGKGLDQGAASKIAEEISASILQDAPEGDRPLLGPSDAATVRTYIGVGVDRRGHLGRFSKRVAVALAPAPPPPSRPSISYSEKAITVRWNPRAIERPPASEPGLLPSRSLGSMADEVAFNVYDSTSGARLTQKPIKETEFEDARIEWGATRCYAVRAVAVVGASPLESEGGEASCQKLVDTFPPAPPKELKAVATDGAINLIWEANAEPDLAGYYVLRAQLPGTTFQRLTAAPLQDATFLDNVQTGVRFAYVVVAVDTAGNQSAPSNRVEETAR
jgi:hypothetical protein